MVKFNCLAKTLENALEIHKITEGNTFIGMLSKDFDSVEAAAKEMNRWSKELDGNISIGLGGGDPKQCYMVTELTGIVDAVHANQVFTEVPATRNNTKTKDMIINSLISPSGQVGKVILSTGPNSSKADKPVLADIETAAIMIKEMGGSAIKFFSMKNMKSDDELKVVAEACAKNDLILELTGGISLDNIEKYLKIAKDAGVKKILPHVYGSIVDQDTGLTNTDKVKQIWEILRKY